jgi:hypothetical protein
MRPIFASLVMVFCGIAFWGLGTVPRGSPFSAERILDLLAAFATAVVFSVAWGVLATEFARKFHWSARTCRFCGAPLFAAGLVWLLLGTPEPRLMFWPIALISVSVFSGLVCRRQYRGSAAGFACDADRA